MRGAIALCLALVACDRHAPPPAPPRGAGAGLERAAIAAGVIADPAALDPSGAYASDSDRACVVRGADGLRIGAAVDYGEGQGCVARGTARGAGRIAVDLGDDCRFEARFDGERLMFPATLPDTCDRACTGRATLSALTAARLSGSATEAQSMRTANGQPLCGN